MEEEIFHKQESRKKISIIGMIHSPIEQFKKIKTQPVILVGLIVILVLSLINGIMGTFFAEEALINEFNDFGEQELLILLLFTKVLAVIGSLIAPIIGLLIKTVVLLIIAKIIQSTVSFKQLFSMNIYIGVIGAIGVLINTSVVLVSGTNDITMIATSLSSVITASGALAGLLSSIEIFNIWMLILTALGMQVIIGVSKKLSWILIVTYFILTTLVMVGSMAILDTFEMFM